tara:strand:- start:109 stop:633 length:525 start_codon:yes stop_codon:yes gene_type:complete
MKLGVLCSGNGTNFENIVRTCKRDEVVVMICNNPKAGAIARARKFGIPFACIKHDDEDTIINMLQDCDVDLIILAGWMRIVTKRFLDAFPDKVINLHPSLLPKYKGLNVIQRAMDAGEKETGCTVHFVNEELDSGQIILQRSVPIEPDDTLETLTRRIQLMEYAILPAAVDCLR